MLFLTCYSVSLQAQNVTSYSLQQLTDSALKNNHTLSIKEWQIKEKLAKVSEDKIKKYPSTTVNSNYQYNFILGEITIPAGTPSQIVLGYFSYTYSYNAAEDPVSCSSDDLGLSSGVGYRVQ